MQLGLAGAVAADRVQVHAGRDHRRRQDHGVALVRSHRGHDVGTSAGLARRRGAYDAQVREFRDRVEVAHELGRGPRVDVEQAQFADAEQPVKRERLELALRAVADQRHHPAVGPGHPPGRECGHGRRTQRRRHGEFGQQERVTGIDRSEHAERGDREQTLCRVLRVAVHVLERVQRPVGRGHQLDDADRASDWPDAASSRTRASAGSPPRSRARVAR